MIKQSNDYLLWNENEIDLGDAVRYFANSPYGIIYMQNKNRQITGIITVSNVMKGIHQSYLEYNASFFYALSQDEAVEKMKNSTRIHAAPVLDRDMHFMMHVQKNYQVPLRFLNGIKYKLSNYSEQCAEELWNRFGMKKIIAVITQDTNSELLELLRKNIVGISFCSFEEFECSLHKKDESICWVDAGSDYTCRKLRRYLWSRGSKHSRFYFLKDFLNLLNNCQISINGLEQYMIQILTIYKSAAIYGHDRAVKEIAEKYKGITEIQDITDQAEVVWNAENEHYDIFIKEEKTVPFNILVIADLLQADNVPFYLNGKFVYYDNYYWNCERYFMQAVVNKYLPYLQKEKIAVLFIQLAKYDRLLKHLEFQGNEAGKDFGNNRIDGKNFLAYTEEINDYLYEEINGMGKTPRYMKNLKVGALDYAVERNPDQLENPDSRSIHIFGCCLINGVFVCDEDTIAARIKRSYPKCNVYSHGSLSVDLLETFQFYGSFKSGDIVIIMPTLITAVEEETLEHYGCSVIELSPAFLNVKNLNKNIWQVPLHCNHIVMDEISDLIVSEIKDMADAQMPVNRKEVDFRLKNDKIYNEEDLENYLLKLRSLNVYGEVNGAIVMNCNPYTNGHHFLIKEAASQVDQLFVFVVEEDKSYFSFEDRYELVCQNCSELNNVVVIPSGKFVISALTMPGYFEKDELQDSVLDASMDLEIFAYKIAPILKIRKRFVGTEPLDKFTAQYNHEMKRILPKGNITVVEVERLKTGDRYVSASAVRKLIEKREIEKIRNYVPDATYNYITERFSM